MNDRTVNHNIDLLRSERTNIPEVVLARFKDDDSLLKTVNGLLADRKVLVTKCTEEQLDLLKRNFSGKVERSDKTSGTMVISDTSTQSALRITLLRRRQASLRSSSV